MTATIDKFTSTGHKFFAHQEAMRDLRNGQGHPIVTHLMPTDICNHECAFCSVQTRVGVTLPLRVMTGYVDLLIPFGLKAVIISGGGNPILYNHKEIRETGGTREVIRSDFNDLVFNLKRRGLEIGLITNGMPLETIGGRRTWKGITLETLDALTWCRISMSGFDHKENQVYVPDFDRTKTTLGFSYVLHDTYVTPDEPNHGQVSTYADIKNHKVTEVLRAEDRIPILTRQIAKEVYVSNPEYVRLLPNCLEPSLIQRRIEQLRFMADKINQSLSLIQDGDWARCRKDLIPADYTPAFVQYKPPAAPSNNKCYLGYIHPVLNSDGFVYPCDSCVLNETADHKFAESWRVCQWNEVDKLFAAPIRSLIGDPSKQCPGCVFWKSNELLGQVVDGNVDLTPPAETPQHVNFV